MKWLTDIVAVAGGAALGGVARFGVARAFAWTALPAGTFVVNIAGSLFLGWFLTVAGDRGFISPTFRLAVATGFVGAFTTFSTFMYESDQLLNEREWWRASAYVLGSVALGLVAVRAGVILAGRA